MRRVTALLLLLLCSVTAAPAGEPAGPLLEGVGEISAPGVPGPLCVFGEGAFPVVVGRSGKGVFEPVVAAAEWGSGRVVAFGHGGYFGGGAIRGADTGRLIANSVRWAARGRKDPVVGVAGAKELAAFLKVEGFEVRELGRGRAADQLRGLTVLCADAREAGSYSARKALRAFVKSGGGLVTASLGWGWKQLNPGKSLATDHPGNLLLGPMGLAWGDGTLDRTTRDGYLVGSGLSRLVHAGRALDLIEEQGADGPRAGKKELAQASASVLRAMQALPPEGLPFVDRIRQLARGRKTPDVPSATKPLGASRAVDRILLSRELMLIPWDEPRKIAAHPAASEFPGEVPDGAPRVAREILVRPGIPGWHGTGLYAAPGEIVTVEGGEGLGLELLVGCHRDRLWHKVAWSRVPEITRSFPLASKRIELATPFGGLLYTVAPGSGLKAAATLRISGAVEAPRFVLGQTDPKEWRKDIRELPAPWAELETAKVVLTVPSSVAVKLEDPRPLLEFWDTVLDACADLACRPRERERPERYVADVQISAGYMHSGYPIMTHLDAAEAMLSLPSLRGKGPHGYWGLYHEMGHNHQSGDWTFDGATEVTVNLFTLYVCETVCGIEGGHEGVRNGPKSLREHLAAGADFEVWKRKPFLALYMYAQLKEAFGWEAFKKVFAEYRDLPESKRPRSDGEKRDQWLVRFSRTVGRNLGPFFDAWGVPTSGAARESVADLPEWMPEDWPR